MNDELAHAGAHQLLNSSSAARRAYLAADGTPRG